VNLEEAVAARRSVRSFQARPVPSQAIERAISLAVQAPAPHHSSPWRFAVLTGDGEKVALARAMGAAWRSDLTNDGIPAERIEAILQRSHRLLTGAPVITICCADTTRAHDYPDEARRLAEWSLFAHSVGAALQTFMMALAESDVASCWLSAPVFCRSVVKEQLGLPPLVEPHALVLAGYAAADYVPRPRPTPEVGDYLVGRADSLLRREQEA
jgi:coenzyme F420-0:L-glutamate ligase/coenzyme F420-1:gamma-L-glutamate ligase